jgi:peptidoglycan glycosyltransferase
VNRNIRRLGVVIIGLYLILFVKLNWIQVVQKQSLDTNPLNTAQVRRDYNRPRGSISSADGALLAQSIANPDQSSEFDRIRVYPEGELFGQITGFFSFTFGSTAVERQYNDELAGTTFDQQVSGFADLFVARENVGNLSVTVRKDVQQVARDTLGDRAGSVVAIDPRSGDLLAFWSSPSYDPNAISTLDSTAANENWTRLNAAPGNPLRSHQFQDRYFPGSTFKVVTSGIGLQTGRVTDVDPSYPFSTGYTAKNTSLPIKNFGGEVCGGVLPEILKTSCNSAFAEMGAETIGADDMVAGAADWGFNSTPPIDLPGAVRSVFPTDVANNAAKLAQSAIGQNDVQASPLQMALVAAGVANRGTIMKPHVLAEVRNSQGEVVKSYTPTPWLHPLSEGFADELRRDMLGVVAGGTATALAIPGFEVGGKTGTAQLGTTPPRSHTWMIGFAGPPGQPPTVAVAVVVLDQPGASEFTGGVVAAPIARAVMLAALTAQGLA